MSDLRDHITDESTDIIEHCETFLKHIRLSKKQREKLNISDFDDNKIWTYSGRAFKYAFVAIAKPQHEGIWKYRVAVKRHIQNGVNRIYIVGAGNEVDFTNLVIDSIQRHIKGIKINQKFKQYRDYRGDYGGIGAIFSVVK